MCAASYPARVIIGRARALSLSHIMDRGENSSSLRASSREYRVSAREIGKKGGWMCKSLAFGEIRNVAEAVGWQLVMWILRTENGKICCKNLSRCKAIYLIFFFKINLMDIRIKQCSDTAMICE